MSVIPKTMRELIKNALVNVHTNCTTDQYGQMGKYNLSMYSLFKERTEEVEEYIKTDPLFTVSTYGGRGGVYRAITTIVDPEIKRLCNEAFAKNPNRLRNLNRW